VPDKFTITDTVSIADWGSVDKTRIRNMLIQGLGEGDEGIREAIREVYAVIRGANLDDAPSQNWVMPHHEIRDDGRIVLNRAGLIAAAAALAGARSEPNLTPQQKRQAARHLLRHYRELELEPPESLAEFVGEMASVQAVVSGEMKVEDVPLASWADLQALKASDPEPMEVVVEIPAGKSKRGWNYRPEALQKIVGEVMNQGLPGFLGHQKPEDVDSQFPTPVTHWVGALWKDGKAYFRGVIDKAAADLKRWIKAKTVRTVSIFGIPKLQQAGGETHVVDYKPLSIDWTPLGRAGMPTSVVAIGEMDEIVGELDGSHEELHDALLDAVRNALGVKGGPDSNAWLYKVFDTYVIVEYRQGQTTKLYSIPYKVEGDELKLGQKTEVTRKEIFEPLMGEMDEILNDGGGQMSWKEYVEKLKEMLASKEVTVGQIVGEMGWEVQEVVGEIDIKWLQEVTSAVETLGKVKEVLGVTGEMDVVKVAQDAKKILDESAKAAREKLIEETIKEKVAGEMAQALVKKMLQLPEGELTKEVIAGEIDKLLADEVVKNTISKFHIDKPPFIGGTETKDSAGVLRVKRQTI
jgi:hypothetical protein